MAVSIKSADPTDLFVGTEQDPRQVLRVVAERSADDGLVTLSLSGEGVRGAGRLEPGDGEAVVELGFAVGGPETRAAGTRETERETDHETGPDTAPGAQIDAVLTAESAAGDRVEVPVRITLAEPGWTMTMVSHFHYDPVWWNTQAGYTQNWELQGDDGSTRPVWENNAFHLVRAHLDLALADPDYSFVLAEVDYLKPFWDVHPQYRQVLRELIAAGRVEVMGGTYNEPNTNLTGLETTVRNLVYGIGYQRDIMGADPQTAWQLDVFGHDPQFPGLVAEAGLSSTSWARGPFHQWGPMLTECGDHSGDVKNMQFPAEFEWLSPSGQGVVTHYMPNHYSAGWWMDSSATLEEAEEKVYELFLGLKQAAATKNTLLPVGTDYTPPNKWVTEIHRDWNARYVWPRFVTGTPRDFFAGVQAELAERGVRPVPQTRDMNPVYTGKDVSYIDTKQAQRAAEVAATDAEKLATFAALLGLGRYPSAALDKVWRQLAYGAHHDAITGSESDQVYIDLVTGWREAHDLAAEARDAALTALVGAIDTSAAEFALIVFNTLAFQRTDLVRAAIDLPEPISGLRLFDDAGTEVPYVIEACDATRLVLAFVAAGVPGLGWRSWRLNLEKGVPAGSADAPSDAWDADLRWHTTHDGSEARGESITNEFYRISADFQHGGALDSVVELATGRQLLKPGEFGNELRVYEEYPQHPEFGEGPWHLVPNGRVVSSTAAEASSIRIEQSAIGSRIVVTGEVGEVRYEQRITLVDGLNRVDLRTRVLDFTGADRLLRVKFPVDVPGARPVSEVAGAVIARGFALPDSDVAVAPWTLDNPANTFFAASSTAHLNLIDPDGAPSGKAAIAIAEVVVADLDRAAEEARDLVIALARVGVTATTTSAEGARYGWLHVDSNLPDLRIVLSHGEDNSAAAEILDRCPESVREEFQRQLKTVGAVRLFVPAETSVEQAWVPNADLRDLRALPVLLIAGADRDAFDGAVEALAEEIAEQAAATVITLDAGPTVLLDQHTVGLVSYGIPGFAVDPAGALHLSLMRSCTGWPSGVWLDPPLRRAPDGSAFQLQHWTHDFHYSLVSGAGDWRSADLVSSGAEFSTPLLARFAQGHPGDLPPTHALISLTPERAAQVTTVKPSGNPEAVGSALAAEPELGVTVRLVEATGLGSTVSVRSPLGALSSDRADLLEECGIRCQVRASGAVPLVGAQVATAIVVPHKGAGSADSAPVLGRSVEPAQPVYSRYWLHNRGPAPLGFLPVSVAVTPTLVRDRGEVTVAVASQYTDMSFNGELTVLAPDGWSVEPEERPVSLGPGGHSSFPLEITPPEGAEPGLYFVRVQLRVGGGGGGGGAVVEDVVSVLIGGEAAGDWAPPARGDEIELGVQTQGTKSGTGRATGLDIVSVPAAVTVAPGERARLAVGLVNRTRSRIDGEAMPVSPWGTWEFVGPYATGFGIEAGAEGSVEFEVDVPIDAEPGHWWVMVKLMWFGRAQYTEAVPVVVR